SHGILDLRAADGEDDDLVALAAEFLPDAKRLLGRVRVPLVEREVEVVRIDIARIGGELDLVAENCDLLDANDDLHVATPFTRSYARASSRSITRRSRMNGFGTSGFSESISRARRW